ncbi:U3 small nucleolar ribonucleoprotein complex, subunit Mpp10 [Aspergillus varians]
MGSSHHTRDQPGPEASDLVPFPLNSALSTPWDFLRPTKRLRTGILDTAKVFLDTLAVSVCDSQTTRQRNHRKRKRPDDNDDSIPILQLKQLYVDGFTSDQIWEQALRIFDSTDHEIQRDYTILARNVQQPVIASPGNAVHLNSTSQEDVSSEDEDSISDIESITDGSSVDEQQARGQSDVKDKELSQSGLDQSDDEEDGLDGSSADQRDDNPGTYVEDRFGLNDGFFSLDDFNKQTELFERQDARGDLDDESDEDEIDWDADPLGAGGFGRSSQTKVERTDDDMSQSDYEEDEDGPTFDGTGVHDESDTDEDEAHAATLGSAGFFNTSDILYADFFAPPPRKASTKKSRPLPKTQPHDGISDHDVDRAMADVRRDLFDDELSAEDSENEPKDTRAHKSTHEKQRARIADEIRRLESANVAKKEWMVSGEARAAERPTNSLIEEDLDFERIGKPVPVVTTELSESIEELIKRRIIAKEFDEVIRRRPGLSDRQNTQESRIELEDNKSQQGLAELYEADHLRATDSNYVDPKNQKLLREHTEVSNLWREISSQLDTLSNWHYKPKAPQASINVVTDVATITMEDAQPTAGGAVRASATLAPQEIYAPGETARATGEVVMRNGVPVTKEEMTREEKAKLRRRQKKLGQSSADPSKQRSGTTAEKQQIVSDLKKAGVKLIGKEGEVTDINGSKDAGMSDRNGAYAMKL